MKLFKFIGMVCVTILLSVGFASCSSKDNDATGEFSIVGTWQASFEGESQTQTWTFYPNGTYECTTPSSEWGYDGNYTYSNGTLTYTDRSYTIKDGKKEYTGGSSTFIMKVEVVSPTKMIWTNIDHPKEKATVIKK